MLTATEITAIAKELARELRRQESVSDDMTYIAACHRQSGNNYSRRDAMQNPELAFISIAVNAICDTGGCIEGSALQGLNNILDTIICDTTGDSNAD